MKRILIVMLLLFAFNANARCFNGSPSGDDYFECYIVEGIATDMNDSFLYRTLYYRGVLYALYVYDHNMLELNDEQIKEYMKCTDVSISFINDIIKEKLKNAELNVSDQYDGAFIDVVAERRHICFKKLKN